MIDEGELGRNYTSRGGKVEVQSQECAAQEERELNTLMVVYTSPSDIPASPREPVDPNADNTTTEQSFGTPQESTKVNSIK